MKNATPAIDNRAGELMTIPLSLLVPSVKHNVRTKGKAAVNIDSLAASIEAQGLMQNLTVIRASGAAEKYEVVAGGRRLLALRALAKARKIDKDEPINCKLTTEENAEAASLTENVQREAMHPADEFEAFARLVDAGKPIEDVAAAFGTSPLTVKRRLTLGKLAPALLDAYRNDEANLDQLMALALTDDQEQQLRIWTETPEWQRDAHNLRWLVTKQEIEVGSNPVVRYVTVKAYEEAGGVVRRDLFAEDGQGGYIQDAELLHRLANERIAKHVRKVAAEGWAWVEPRLVIDFADTSAFTQAKQTVRPLTKKEQGAMDRVAERVAKLAAELDELNADDSAEAQDRAAKVEQSLEAAEQEQETLTEQFREWADETKALAGALVGIDRQGKAHVVRGLIRPQDRKAAAKLPRDDGQDEREGTADEREPQGYSEALMRRLTAHRTLGVQVALNEQPGLAMRVLAHALASSLLIRNSHRVLSSIKGSDAWHSLATACPDAEASDAWKALKTQADAWTDRLGGEDGDVALSDVIALSDADVGELLTLCVALSVNTIAGRENEDGEAVALMQALRVDMTRWWLATSASYFNHVPKARILEVLGELKPGDKSPATKKKAELAELAAAVAGPAGWLPPVLRAIVPGEADC